MIAHLRRKVMIYSILSSFYGRIYKFCHPVQGNSSELRYLHLLDHLGQYINEKQWNQ